MVFYSKETMSERDTISAFCDGLKKAEFHAKEMAKFLKNEQWMKTAEMLEGLRENGVKLAHMKSMSSQERDEAIGLKLGTNLNPLRK